MKKMNQDDLKECIVEVDDGILLSVEVKPGSRGSEISGYDKWRKCVEIKVKAHAEKQKANKELMDILSSILFLPSENITIFRGATSRKKEIKMIGITKSEVIKKIVESFQ
jgi:uncharacterized protein (TIGR00251 family)